MGRDEEAQGDGEGAGKEWELGRKGICDLSRKVLELKWEDATT